MMQYQPRSIEDRAYWTSFENNRTTRKLLNIVRHQLPAIPDRLPMPTASEYLAARRSNNRGLLDMHWRDNRPRFARLVLNRLVLGLDPSDPDDRLLNWLFDYTFEPCWAVSAHLPKNDLPASGDEQLDLAGCEMAGELAETLEVLLPWVNAQSRTLAASIVAEIDRRCLSPFVAGSRQWWSQLDHPHVNNWSGVCGGSLLTACLALEKMGHPRPEARKKALAVLRRFFECGFTASGECDEGPGYWSYGVEFACLAMSRMERAEIERELDAPRIRQVAGYLERTHIHGNAFFAGNDSGAKVHAPVGTLSWLADFTNSDFLRQLVVRYPAGPGRTVGLLLRDLQMAAHASQWTAATTPPATDPARLLPDQQVAILQRQGQRERLTFTLSGGHNAESHNHNDLGTFQLLLDEAALIPDLGAPHYTTDFFGPQRYVLYTVARSDGHCCPLINGQEQPTGKEFAGKVVRWEPQTQDLTLDLSAAYAAEAGLSRWTRRGRLTPAGLGALIEDEYCLARGGEVVHRIWLRDKTEIIGTALRSGRLNITLEPAPAKLEIREFQAGQPGLLLREYPPDKTLYRLEATYPAKANEPLRVATTMKVE